jgi:hypothetical protein
MQITQPIVVQIQTNDEVHRRHDYHSCNPLPLSPYRLGLPFVGGSARLSRNQL